MLRYLRSQTRILAREVRTLDSSLRCLTHMRHRDAFHAHDCPGLVPFRNDRRTCYDEVP